MASRAAVRKQTMPLRQTRTARKPTQDGDARPALRTVKPPLVEQFHVAVDRQLKSAHPTYKEAEDAALAIKKRHPRLDVTVYDSKDDVYKSVALPGGVRSSMERPAMLSTFEARKESGKRRLPQAAMTQHALERSLLYSEELGINLAEGSDAANFRWFLASLLFGARISETIAKNTYRAFVRHRLTHPAMIIRAGWDFLVDTIMREGGYVRYDGRKSTQVLRDCEMLLADYGGSLERLHESARDARDLEDRVLAFYGVGPVTMNIFLRELRPFWAKADPDPLPIVRKLARRVSVDLAHYNRKRLVFARVEAGLLRRRRGLGAAEAAFRMSAKTRRS